MLLDQFGRPIVCVPPYALAIPSWVNAELMKQVRKSTAAMRRLDVAVTIERLRRSCGVEPDETVVVGTTVGVRIPVRPAC